MNRMDRLDRVDGKMPALTRAKSFNHATETLDTRLLWSQMQHIGQLLRHDKEVQDAMLIRVDTVTKTLQTEDGSSEIACVRYLPRWDHFEQKNRSSNRWRGKVFGTSQDELGSCGETCDWQ